MYFLVCFLALICFSWLRSPVSSAFTYYNIPHSFSPQDSDSCSFCAFSLSSYSFFLFTQETAISESPPFYSLYYFLYSFFSLLREDSVFSLFSLRNIFLSFTLLSKLYYLTAQPSSARTILPFQFLPQDLPYPQHRNMYIFKLPLRGLPGSPCVSTFVLTRPAPQLLHAEKHKTQKVQARQLQGRAKGHRKGTFSPSLAGCRCQCHQDLEKRSCRSLGEPTEETGRWEGRMLCNVQLEPGMRKGD